MKMKALCGPQSNMTVVLIQKRKFRHRSLHIHRGKTLCRYREMTTVYKPRRKTSEETNPADALILDFQRTSTNGEERNLRHPQQPNMPFSEANRQEMKNIFLAATFSSVQFSSILKVMGIPDHLTCLLRNLYEGQEATIRSEHGTG